MLFKTARMNEIQVFCWSLPWMEFLKHCKIGCYTTYGYMYVGFMFVDSTWASYWIYRETQFRHILNYQSRVIGFGKIRASSVSFFNRTSVSQVTDSRTNLLSKLMTVLVIQIAQHIVCTMTSLLPGRPNSRGLMSGRGNRYICVPKCW